MKLGRQQLIWKGAGIIGKADTPLAVVLKGAMAGLAGALAIKYAMLKAQEMMQPEVPEERPERAAEQPVEDPREKFVRKVASGIFEVELSDEERKTWAEMLHWEYGAFWGVVYGIVQATLWLPLWLHGLILATVVWITGPLVLLPAMKLTPPPQSQPLPQLSMGWLFHAAYGLTTAVVFGLLSWGRRPEQEAE